MTTFQSFDSMESMYAHMAAAEAKANEALHPKQAALRDAHETVYWMRPAPEFDCVIFGECPPLAETLASEAPKHDEDADAEERAEAEAEYRYTVETMTSSRARGYLFGTAYSILEPRGELGDTHVANAWPISKEAFEQARAAGWQPTRESAPALSEFITSLLEQARAQR